MESVMRKFMDSDFLLKNAISKKLYEYAEKMPIFDYHCHLNPKEIAENKS
ncbi:MAG: glucuronate isomerase, partial [Cetobacterium sp.]